MEKLGSRGFKYNGVVHCSASFYNIFLLIPQDFLFSLRTWTKLDSMYVSVVFHSYVNFILGFVSVEFYRLLSFFRVTHSSFRNCVNVHLSNWDTLENNDLKFYLTSRFVCYLHIL